MRVLAVLLAFIALAGMSSALSNVSSCQVISASDVYTLNQSLAGAPNSASPLPGSACLLVSANSVTINCMGFNVTNNETGITYGVLALGPLSNFSLRNCTGISNYSYGAYLYQTNRSNVTNGTLFNNTYGVLVDQSANTNLTNLTLYGNGNGIFVNSSNSTNLSRNNISNSSAIGVHVLDSNLTREVDDLFRNNTVDFLVNASDSVVLNLTRVKFDSPSAPFSNMTNLSLNGTLSPGSAYSISWAPFPATAPPVGFRAFKNQSVNITALSGSVSIDRINWHWFDADLGPTDESRLSLFLFNGTSWNQMNLSPSTSANTLTLNVTDAGIYAMLDNNGSLSDCSLLSLPGQYQLTSNVLGAPNPSPLGGSSCMLMNSSNVTLNCQGFNITENGTAGTTYGVITSPSLFNVTVRNCANISSYTYGVYFLEANRSNLTNSTIFNSTFGMVANNSNHANLSSIRLISGSYGIYADGGAGHNISNATLLSNSALGLYLSAINSTIRNVSASFSPIGILINASNNTSLLNNRIYNNSVVGLQILDSGFISVSNDSFFANPAGLLVNSSSVPSNLTFSGLLLSPFGNLTNHTNLTINDTMAAPSAYSINWSAEPAPPPSGNISFEGKYADISNLSGNVSIDVAVWSWLQSELSGYMENRFALYKYNTTDWVPLNVSPSVSLNTLTLRNFSDFSVFGIIQDNGTAVLVSSCPNINAPDRYVLTNNINGSPNNASEISSGNFACVKINASNVVFDCAGFNITGSAPVVDAGILITSSASNVTVMNCGNISNYTYGMYLRTTSGHNITNNTVSGGGDGILIYQGSGNLLSNNSIIGAAFRGIYLQNTTNNRFLNNIVQEAGTFDVELIAVSTSFCNHNFTNTTGTGGRPINYTNVSVNWSDFEAAQVILCNADNSILNNITVIGSPTKNNGLMLFQTNLTVVNGSVVINASNAYRLVNSTRNNFTLNSAFGSIVGIDISAPSWNNTFSDNYANNSTYGAFIASGGGGSPGSSFNRFINNTFSFGVYGVYTDLGADRNIFINNTAFNHSGDSFSSGFRFEGGDHMVVWNNTAYNNAYGVFIQTQSNYSIINNTLFNDSSACLHMVAVSGCTDNMTLVNNLAFNCGTGFSVPCANATVANNTAYNTISGFYFNGLRQSNISGNLAYNNSGRGFILDGQGAQLGRNNLFNNTAYNNTVGFALWFANFNNFTNNTLSGNANVGLLIHHSANNNVTDSTIQENGIADLDIVAFNDTSCNNRITDLLGSGGRPINYTNSSVEWADFESSEVILCNADRSNITNATIRGSDTLGNNFLLLLRTQNATVRNSDSSENYIGFYIVNSSNNSVGNNSAGLNGMGILLYNDSNQNFFSNNTIFRSALEGIFVNNSNRSVFSAEHLYNNSIDLRWRTDARFFNITLANIIFDNPFGNFTNFTNFSLQDNNSASAINYTFSWSSVPASPPGGKTSFLDKYISIIRQSGTNNLDRLAWHWRNDELGAFSESELELWKFSANWTLQNTSPNTAANTLSLSNVSSLSVFGLFGVAANCPPPITSPGTTVLSDNLAGSTNSVPHLSTTACVVIASSDVTFDCGGFNISGVGSGIGIVLNDSVTNVTVKNCPRISNYDDGVYIYNSSNNTISNVTADDTFNTGFTLDTSSDNVLSNNTAINSQNGFHLTVFSGSPPDASRNNLFINNVAYNHSVAGFQLFMEAHNNTFINNTAYLNDWGFIAWISQENDNNTFINNTAYNNFQPGFEFDFNSDGNTLIGNLAYNNTFQGFLFFGSNGNLVVNNTAFLARSFGQGFLLQGTGNVLRDNIAHNNTDIGFLDLSGNNTFINNTAFNNSYSGFYISSNYNTLINNTAYNNTQTGFTLDFANHNILINNTAFNHSEGVFTLNMGLFIQSSFNNSLHNNTAYRNRYGFYLNDSTSHNFTGNTGFNNTNTVFFLDEGASDNFYFNNTGYSSPAAFYIELASDDNSFLNNTAYLSGLGFSVLDSVRNNFSGNTAHSNDFGFFMDADSDNSTLMYNTVYNNTDAGFFTFSYDNRMIGDHYYRNGRDVWIEEYDNLFQEFIMSAVIFDNPAGNLVNYTNLSLNATQNDSGYFINWSAQPGTPPPIPSFAGKFVTLNKTFGSTILDSVIWHWLDSEINVSDDESSFVLYKFNSSGWTAQNASPNNISNTLSLFDLSSFSVFGVLQNVSPPPLNDTAPPNVTLNSPANGSLFNVSGVTFNFTAIDDASATMNCSLLINGSLSQGNSSTQNGSPTTFTQSFSNGERNWSVRCTDESNNTGISETRLFTVNVTAPLPSDEDNDDENDPLDISLSSSCSGNTVTVASRGDPVSGASVRVDGTLMEATGSNGQMSFKGCDDTVEIRASKSGYETEEKNFQLISCSACEEPEQNDTNQTEPEPQFECYSNSDCPITDYCLIPAGAAGGTCEPVIPGSCGEVKNHSFVPFGYECGNETGCPACPGGQICQEHACVSYNLTGPANVTLNSTANIVATKEGGPCILCEIIVTDPAGRTFGGRTDEKGLFTLPTPLRGIYIVSLMVDGQVYKSIQIIAVPGEAPVEPQKPPVTTPQEEFPWWLLILVLLIILGIAYWRRRKRGREPAARGKQ